MDQSQLKHEWTLNRESWYIRLFLWVWPAEHLTFCKLFWGYVFLPVGLAISLFLMAILFVGDRLPKAAPNTGPSRPILASTPIREEKKEREPSKFLKWVEETAAKIGMFIGSVMDRYRRPIMWFGMGLAILAGLTLIGLVSWIVANNWDDFITGIQWAGIIVGGAALAYLFGSLLARFLKPRMPSIRRGGKKTKQGAVGFFTVMKQGAIAVKTNTCPRIVLEGDESGEPEPNTATA